MDEPKRHPTATQRTDALLTALRRIAAASLMPADWRPYYERPDGYSPYTYCNAHTGEIEEGTVDESDPVDVHIHGAMVGRWESAKVARAALAQFEAEGRA